MSEDRSQDREGETQVKPGIRNTNPPALLDHLVSEPHRHRWDIETRRCDCGAKKCSYIGLALFQRKDIPRRQFPVLYRCNALAAPHRRRCLAHANA